MLNTFLRNLLGADEAPNKVTEVRSESYVSRPIRYREDSITLFSPKNAADAKTPREKLFDIVLQTPFAENLFSLFSTESQETAEERFNAFKDKIPTFVKMTKECNVTSLQRLCDTLTENASWTVAHLVANFGTSDLFNLEDVQRHINDQASLTGTTPIMVAIKAGNLPVVQRLISLKCNLDAVDRDGNTVFHYAAATSKDMVSALAAATTTGLNVYNKQGHTPLHMACKANKPDCVYALICAGADVNLSASRGDQSATLMEQGILSELFQDNTKKLYEQDMKHGGTPLHWAISREVIEVLISKNCDIDVLNFEGRTALHLMALRGRLECAIALLSRAAEHSLGDNDGNTPLHLAVKQKNVAIVQALIVFGADVNAQNKDGGSVRHAIPAEMNTSVFDKILYVLHAVGAKRCPPQMAGCPPSCAAGGHYNGVPPPDVARAATRDAIAQMLAVAAAAVERADSLDHAKKTGRLLCLDGGWIRGLILVQILLALEATIGKPVIHCFDWVAGTSTGGILALALATGKTLRECQSLYFRLKVDAFVGMRPYASEALETILKETLGTETVMADIDHPKLMILALLADRKPVDLHIFRNFRSAQEILDEHNGTASGGAEAGDNGSVSTLPPPPPPTQQLVWQAARATGAAPSYFRAYGRYLDGGLIGNNPTLDALTELVELRLALKATGQLAEANKCDLKVVVSCGTGLIPVTKLQEIDVFKPESLLDTAKLACGISSLSTLLVDQATLCDGRVVDRARAWCSNIGVPYYRLSPQLSRDLAMDERSDERIVCALWECAAYMYAQRDRAAEIARILC